MLRVVAVDLPGHGDSDPMSEVTLEGYADVARGVLEALGTDPVVAIGHSLGGAVALMLAARHPKIVKRLVLVSSCARLPPRDGILETLLWLLPGPIRKLVFSATAKRISFAPGAPMHAVRLGMEEIRTCPSETILKDTAAARAMNLDDLARGLSVPTLILCGERDRLTPAALSGRLRDLIPDSRLHLVTGAGHMLPLEAPRQISESILEFVRSCPGTGVCHPLRAGETAWSIVRRLLDKARALLRAR